MKKFVIVINTRFGRITVDDVVAKSHQDAFEFALIMVKEEIDNWAELDEYIEIK